MCTGERRSFRETNTRVNRLVSGLARLGAQREARVLWLAQNCHRALETLFACAKLGAVFVPANWRQSPDEMAFTISDARPSMVIWQAEEIGDRVAKVRAGPGFDAVWIQHDGNGEDSYETLIENGSDAEPGAEVEDGSAVVQMYTAAFEGRPRGALITHRNLLVSSLQLALAQRLSWEDVHLASMPFFHIFGLANALATFHVGGTNVVVRRSDPKEMTRLISEEHVTRAVVIGPQARQMIEAAEKAGHDLSSLRTPRGAGGPDAKRWAELTSPTLPPMGGYGQTELTGQATFDAYGPPGAGTHGHAAPLAVVRIFGEDDAELPDGEAGEIVVRGPQATLGYADGGSKMSEGWHRTGDLGRREPDGSISFIGPKTGLIKTGAENVYPAEVEAALGRHPAVKESCVFGVSDPVWRQAVKAVVVLRDGRPASAAELIEFCKQHIASYKKPREIEFAATLPRATDGSIDREETKRLHGGAKE